QPEDLVSRPQSPRSRTGLRQCAHRPGDIRGAAATRRCSRPCQRGPKSREVTNATHRWGPAGRAPRTRKRPKQHTNLVGDDWIRDSTVYCRHGPLFHRPVAMVRRFFLSLLVVFTACGRIGYDETAQMSPPGGATGGRGGSDASAGTSGTGGASTIDGAPGSGGASSGGVASGGAGGA